MEPIEIIAATWGWTGLEPAEIVALNDFGNVIVKDINGKFWRICPEELSCEIIAQDSSGFDKLWYDTEFVEDWEMAEMVQLAQDSLGAPEDNFCYCLKTPGCFGGEYEAHNIALMPISELIAFSGDIAEQTKDLPDGSKVGFKWE